MVIVCVIYLAVIVCVVLVSCTFRNNMVVLGSLECGVSGGGGVSVDWWVVVVVSVVVPEISGGDSGCRWWWWCQHWC